MYNLPFSEYTFMSTSMDDLVQSTPCVPPIDTMLKCDIFVFGDLTHNFDEDLQQLLHVKGNASLSDLFNRVACAFRHEFAKLARHEQDWLPRFTSLIDLSANFECLEGAPAMRFALLCLYQLGRFIQYDFFHRRLCFLARWAD